MWFVFFFVRYGVAESFAIKLENGCCTWFDIRYFFHDFCGWDFDYQDFTFLAIQDSAPQEVAPHNLLLFSNGEIVPYNDEV